MSSPSVAYRSATLANGLRVVAETDPAAHTAAVGFFVNTGARDEDAAGMGVSHFLEHMMFKGTAEKSADEVNQAFDDFGADYNAFTSHERTVYYAHVLPEFLLPAADLLGEILRPSLREADFDMEKKVILEEIGMYDDRPEWVLQDRLLERHFSTAGAAGDLHGQGFRVLGTAETVSALTPDRMRAYFEKRYSPGNVAVAAAGNLDFDALVAQVESRCAAWASVDAGGGRDTPKLDAGVRRHADVDADLSRHYLALVAPAPARRTRSATRPRCSASCSATPTTPASTGRSSTRASPTRRAPASRPETGRPASPPGSSWRGPPATPAAPPRSRRSCSPCSTTPPATPASPTPRCRPPSTRSPPA